MKRLAVVLAVFLAVGLVAAATSTLYVLEQLEPAKPGSMERVAFRVEPGSGLRQIANALEAAGLIRNADATVLSARLRGWESLLKAGEYDVSPGQSSDEVLQVLISGRVRTYPVVLPEGIRASEIASRLERAGLVEREAFLRVIDDPALASSLGVPAESLEGYLYPETYEIPGDLSNAEVAGVLVAQFDDAWSEIEPAAKGASLSKHEININPGIHCKSETQNELKDQMVQQSAGGTDQNVHF